MAAKTEYTWWAWLNDHGSAQISGEEPTWHDPDATAEQLLASMEPFYRQRVRRFQLQREEDRRAAGASRRGAGPRPG
jgi:hypothetical protein